jgi:CBS domain-containing protein
MFAESAMTLKSQIAVACFVILCISMIIRLLQKRKITESLFYFWLIVFVGVLIVAMSHGIQNLLTRLIGSYSPLSTMLFLALAFLFGVSMVYSVLLSSLSAKIRDMTAYVAEMRLDMDELAGRRVSNGRDDGGLRVNPYQGLADRLGLTVGELMRTDEEVPIVAAGKTLRDALTVVAEKRVGCTGVVDDEGVLTGVITGGDLKRILAKGQSALEIPVREVTMIEPKRIDADRPASEALRTMELNSPDPIKTLFVTDRDGRPIGMIHIDDILKAGLSAK